MAGYRIRIKKSAVKELDAVASRADRRRIVQRIQKLSEESRPPGCIKLTGQNRYRIRQGRYRIVYCIEDDQLFVFVIRIAQRKDIYRRP